MKWKRIAASLVLAAGLMTAVGITQACPFCAAPERTLVEQLTQADASVLVEWVSGTPADREKQTLGDTSYRVVEVVRQPAADLAPGKEIKLDRFRPGKAGDLFLLMGTKGDAIDWSSPLEVSETSFNYIKQAPGKEVPTSKRLSYYLKFLEYPDPLISNDAYSEFAGAPYQDIAPLADQFSREKLREWLKNPQTVATRLGFYGLMLGLCGGTDDAEFLKEEILKDVKDYRLGVDGMMAGYLLITGPDGVTVLEDAKLKNTAVTFAETYAAMQALRFIWTYAPEKVGKVRLREAMRTLLDRPELADLVITDLARWGDWEVMDRLLEMYGAPSFDNNQTKRAIVRYLLSMSKLKPGDDPAIAENVQKAKAHLEALRAKDPETVKQAEKFFFLN